MADVIKTKGTLQLTLLDSNGNSNLLYIENPKASIAASEIATLNSFLTSSQVVLGEGGTFITEISDAKLRINTTTKLDLTLA